jgi:hypothetical protein
MGLFGGRDLPEEARDRTRMALEQVARRNVDELLRRDLDCKFYTGPQSVAKAIDQLLGYVVWRDTKAALLLFVRRGNFTDVVEKAVEAVANHPQCQRRTPSADPSRRSDFVFTRADDPDRAILLALLPFQLTG